ncbi:hypothetical protein ACFYXC_33280 [Streptomyces sp. NPDC002701]|uniref:hypothetical protein n=1 Tax=Streptomyces sp. NPDC002701 TaxID=3364661 RepID=UPI0036B2841C
MRTLPGVLGSLIVGVYVDVRESGVWRDRALCLVRDPDASREVVDRVEGSFEESRVVVVSLEDQVDVVGRVVPGVGDREHQILICAGPATQTTETFAEVRRSERGGLHALAGRGGRRIGFSQHAEMQWTVLLVADKLFDEEDQGRRLWRHRAEEKCLVGLNPVAQHDGRALQEFLHPPLFAPREFAPVQQGAGIELQVQPLRELRPGTVQRHVKPQGRIGVGLDNHHA